MKLYRHALIILLIIIPLKTQLLLLPSPQNMVFLDLYLSAQLNYAVMGLNSFTNN